MTIPAARAAAATGAGGAPEVVFPSVNITMTLAFEDMGSNRPAATVKASAWLVEPPALSAFTAAFKSATEVISCVSAVAVSEKLTIPIWLPLLSERRHSRSEEYRSVC